MNIVFAGAMISIMALCVFGGVLPLGSVNAELAFPAYICVALLVLMWAAWLFFSRNASWKYSPMHWPVFGFLVYATLRYWFSPLEYDARVELFHVWLCGLVYFLCSANFFRPSDRVVILVTLLLLAVFESGYGIWQAFSKTDAVLGWVRPEGYRGRGSGTLICPNHFAALLELVLGLAVARAALVPRENASLERSTILKVLTVYAALMTVAGIILSFSRAGWASTVVGLSLFLFFGKWNLRSSWPRIALVAVLLAAIAFLWRLDFVRDYIAKSLRVDERTEAVSLADPSLGGRTLMWGGTIHMIRDNPALGTGGGSWAWMYSRYQDGRIRSRPDYTHNDFLNLASDYGLVGVVLMGFIFVGFFRQSVLLTKPGHPPEVRAFAVGGIVSLSILLLHSWFDSSLHIPGVSLVLAVILGFTAAMDDTQRRFLRRPLPSWQRYGLAVALIAVCVFGMWHFVPTAMGTRYTDFGNRLKADLQYDLARPYYDYSLDWDPKSPEPFARIGDIYRIWTFWRLSPDKADERRDLATQGIQAYERSLELNPYQSGVLLDKAKLHETLGQHEDAVRAFERALEIYPNNALAYYRLGFYWRDRGENEKARKAFAESMKLNYTHAAGINELELQTPAP